MVRYGWKTSNLHFTPTFLVTQFLLHSHSGFPFPLLARSIKTNLDNFQVYINRHIWVSRNGQVCCINKAMVKMGCGDNKRRIVDLDT